MTAEGRWSLEQLLVDIETRFRVRSTETANIQQRDLLMLAVAVRDRDAAIAKLRDAATTSDPVYRLTLERFDRAGVTSGRHFAVRTGEAVTSPGVVESMITELEQRGEYRTAAEMQRAMVNP